MSDTLYDALETCLLAIETGASLDQVLKEYPDLREELQPLLEAAILARRGNIGSIPNDVMNRSRTQALTHAAALRSNNNKTAGVFGVLPRLAVALLVVVIVFLTGSSLIVASAKSLPGDQLYPVKRAVENVRLGITVDVTAHQEIEANFQERRLSEVQQLISLQRKEAISFDAKVLQIGDSRWLIGNIIVILTPKTLIIGEITPGMIVEVEGITQPEGWVLAEEIHLRDFKVTGEVEAITPHVWIISGEEIQINEDSQIGPDIQVGQWVVAQIRSTDDGEFYARSIMIEKLLPTITPKPSLTPVDDIEDDESDDIDEGVIEQDDTTPEPDETDEPDELDETDESDDPDDDETDEPDEGDESDEQDDPDDSDDTDEADDSEETDESDDPDETDEPDEPDD